jgi:chemotaxis regulatin CheY-phosphate phosphatase CheZ
MKRETIENLLKKIDMVDCHVRTFTQSFPRILKDTSLYTQSHLVVMQECLPYLKKLLAYVRESTPLIHGMADIAVQGTSDLSKASGHLNEIDQSSERAVQEILDVMERVRLQLEEATKAEDCGPESKEKIEKANMGLFSMMEALQFQDITSQRVQATNALLSQLDSRLGSLIEGMGGPEKVETIKVVSGSFDPEGTYDREKAQEKQQEIDQLIEAGQASGAGNGDSRGKALKKKRKSAVNS